MMADDAAPLVERSCGSSTARAYLSPAGVGKNEFITQGLQISTSASYCGSRR
jgi:hypothetical protein